MKYFLLAEGWSVGRVWDVSGVWSELVHRRKPELVRLGLGIVEANETFWLYQVEEEVVMVEVKRTGPEPAAQTAAQGIAQVLLKRLIGPAEVLERLAQAEHVFNSVLPRETPPQVVERQNEVETNRAY